MFLLHMSFKSELSGQITNRKFVSFCLIEGHWINWQLFTCILNGNVKNTVLFIHGLFKGVLLTAQVIQLRIKDEDYVCYSTTLFSFTGHSVANKVLTYQESVVWNGMILNWVLVRTWKKAFVDFFNYPSWRSPVCSKEENAHLKQNMNNAVVSRNGRFLVTIQLYWRFLETVDW